VGLDARVADTEVTALFNEGSGAFRISPLYFIMRDSSRPLGRQYEAADAFIRSQSVQDESGRRDSLREALWLIDQFVVDADFFTESLSIGAHAQAFELLMKQFRRALISNLVSFACRVATQTRT